MGLRVLNDYLLIEPDPPKSEIETTLVLPEKSSLIKRSHYATIHSCGPDVRGELRPGVRILLDRWFQEGRDADVEVDGQKLRFIAEHQVLGIVEDD